MLRQQLGERRRGAGRGVGQRLVEGVQGAGAASPTSAEELVSPELINRAGWTWNWQTKLPVRTGEAVDQMMVFDDYLYVLTDTNVLFCLDRMNGAMRFVLPLSSRRLPVCSPIYRENKLWFMVGNEMVVVDPWAGTIAERHRFAQIGNTVECGLAMNDSYIYLSGSDNRLHAFSRDGYWRAFMATADDDAPIVSVETTTERVLFAARSGSVVSMVYNQSLKDWQFDTTGSIQAEMVVRDGMVYVGSRDAKLYKLDARTGRSAWTSPFYAGERLNASVVLGRTVVYLPTGTMGVYGIDQTSGQAIWQAPDGIGVLTETATQAFVLSRPGVLNVMDNTTGRELYSVNFSQVKRFAVMMDEPRLYVADKDGRVAAITVR